MTTIHPRVHAAYPWLRGTAYAESGTVFVGPTGETLRLREDGGADPWPPFGHRSIAADPTATRTAHAGRTP